MGLADNALVTLAAARAALKITGASTDGILEDIINRASAVCELYCQRPLKKTTITAQRWPGPRGDFFYPLAVPLDVSAALSVTVNGVAQTVWKTESDGDAAAKDVVVSADVDLPEFRPNRLYRRSGWAWNGSGHPDNVLLTYSGGFTTVPMPLVEACLLIIQKLFRDQDRQLAEVVSVSSPAGGITVLDTVMPRRAADILNRYRRFSV